MRPISRGEFDAACVELSAVVERCALRVLYHHGFYDVQPVPNPPASYTELQLTYEQARIGRTGLFPVYSLYCDDIIYTAPRINHLYRGWHDLSHIELGRGFDFQSELAVAHYKSLSIPEGLQREIMLADAVGESEFAYMTNGKFPLHQRDFAYDYVTRGREYTFAKHQKWMV